MVDEMGFVRLGARFEPTTAEIGFVAAAPGDVAGATAGWIRSLGDGTGIDEIPGGLEAALTRMGALVSGRTKVLVVGTASPWSAVLDNGIMPDPSGVVSRMVDLLGVRGFYIVAEPNVYPPRDAPDLERLGARHFVIEWPDPTAQFGKGHRHVAVQRDSGRRWSFNQYGDPLPFEDTAAYTARRLTDRLTPRMLADYCTALGVDAFNDDFYTGPSRLVHWRWKNSSRARTWTYAQAQAERGWGPAAWKTLGRNP